MSKLKRYLVYAFGLMVSLGTATTGHCQFTTIQCNQTGKIIVPAAPARQTVYDNRFLYCNAWSLEWFSSQLLTIELDGAPDNNGSPGSWVAIQTMAYNGNPTFALSGIMIAQAYFPWVSVNITSIATQNQTISYYLRGNFAPLQTFSAAVSGISTSSAITQCLSNANINVTAGTSVQIVAGISSQFIRVCSVVLTGSAAATVANIGWSNPGTCNAIASTIGTFNLGAGTGITVGSSLGAFSVISTSGWDFCVKATTGNVSGIVTYAMTNSAFN